MFNSNGYINGWFPLIKKKKKTNDKFLIKREFAPWLFDLKDIPEIIIPDIWNEWSLWYIK